MISQKVGLRVPVRDLVLLSVGFVVFIVVGATVAYFSLPLDARLSPRTSAPTLPPGPMVEMGPFTVTLSNADRPSFLRTTLVIEVDQPSELDEMNRQMSQVHSVITATLADHAVDTVRSTHGKQQLRSNLKHAINNQLHGAGVRAVYFRELLYE
jgi:flagellar basal body-associated protein FliL